MSQIQFEAERTIDVLHVDDDEAFVDMVSAFLERTDRLNVTAVTNPREALGLLEEVDCVVSDYQMPEMDGIELLSRVRERDRQLPFILFTGKGSEDVAEQAFSAGATEYLQKEGGTGQYQVLANRIENVVDRYLAERKAERVRQINQVANEVNRALVRATSRSELEERVCEILSRSPLYGSAAIGLETDDGTIETRHHAGFDRDTASNGQLGRTDEVCGDSCESSKTVVRLEYRGNDYGVLCVCSDENRSGGFERRLLERLADDIAHAIDSLETTATLRAERNRLQAIYEASPDALVVFDADGNYERMISGIETIEPADESECGDSFVEFLDGDTRDRFTEACRETIRTGANDRIEFGIECDDRTRWFEAHTAPLEHHVTEDRVLVAVREITDKKDRERRLRTFERIVEEAGHSIYVTGTDGEIEYVNPAFEKITGYSSEEAIGRTPSMLQSGEHDAEFYRELWTTILDGQVWESRIVNERKDGERYVADQTIAPIEDDDGEIEKFVAVNTDVTDSEERRRRYEAIFDRTFEFIGLLEPDGTLIEANQPALEFAGIDRETVVGEPFWEAAWWQTNETTREKLKRAIDRAADGEFVRYEVEVQGDEETAVIDFSLRPVTDDRGEVTLIVPEGRVITELKRREEQFEALNRAIRSLLTAETRGEVAEIGIEAARDVLDLEMSAIHLYDEQEDGLVPAAATAEAERFLESIPTFTEGDSIAWRVYERGEAVAIDDVRKQPDRYNPDTAIRAELIVPLEEHGILVAGSNEVGQFDDRDVTIAEVLAGHVVAALEQIERRQRLKDRNDRLDAFSRTVSHDLRNPLNVAVNCLDLYRSTDEKEHLDRIDDALWRMEDLIDELLSLARTDRKPTELRSVDLRGGAATAWSYVETRDASLEIEETATVEADDERLQRLFENLFRNAVEHGGSDVTVRVGRLADGFYVEDDGKGIPTADRDRMFEAGFSTDPEGTGYGLSIVRSVVDAHGWSIDLEESDAGGVRFEITDVDRLD